MSILQNLVAASQLDESVLQQQARSRQAQWQSWLAPISDAQPTGDDPGYDDDFQRIREEVEAARAEERLKADEEKKRAAEAAKQVAKRGGLSADTAEKVFKAVMGEA